MWVVARTKARRESWAAENVERQGYKYYLPRLRPAKRGAVAPCLFPSYVFIATDGPWRFLLGTFGVTSLVMQGQGPAPLPEDAIDKLRAREGADGYITLPSQEDSRFKPGDAVRVKDGAFSGYYGIYEGTRDQDRVRILLEYLGQQSKVLIGEDALELAG